MRGLILSSMDSTEGGHDVPVAILAADSGEPVGSARFLEIRREHLRVELKSRLEDRLDRLTSWTGG